MVRISHFFIDRPISATVISVAIVIAGLVALARLPVAQYPDIAPPTIMVQATYPGANAKVVAETVAAPIEKEINGVEQMLYMSSKSTNDGRMMLEITFQLGTDLDKAQVLVQNRVAIALARLPEEVRRQGVTTKKQSPSILLCVNLVSPDNTYNVLYLSNYANINIKDALARIPGVGDVQYLGARDYSMRIWLDPNELANRNLTASDVLHALQEQNVQVAAGQIGQSPAPKDVNFQFSINALGRLVTAEEFDSIIIKTGADASIVRLKDVGRSELGAQNYDVNSYLDGKPSVALALYQQPGSNAIATAKAIRNQMEELKAVFPPDVDYRIVYDTTVFIDESIKSVWKTLFEAFVLVFIVVLLFLQDWRATILPMIEVPVALIGTFGVMALLGFSLNNLSLFGLVLAIGIVVDDAIVVIENVERWRAKGLDARAATRKAMEEVTGSILAITLVLCAVFLPAAVISGISGQFYQQFALTIAASTIISAINAMTMTPARCVILFRTEAHEQGGHHQREALPWWGLAILGGLLAAWLLAPLTTALLWAFNKVFNQDVQRVLLEGSGGAIVWTWAIRAAVFCGGAVVGYLLTGPVNRWLAVFFGWFNAFFERTIRGYGTAVTWAMRGSIVMLVVYAGLLALTYLGFNVVPVGFIPQQDKGYLAVHIQLPEGTALGRTDEVVRQIEDTIGATPGVAHTLTVPGYSVLTSNNVPNLGGMFVILDDFAKRKGNLELYSEMIAYKLWRQFQTFSDADVLVFGPPPVDGVGNTGGFKLQVQDRGSLGLQALQAAAAEMIKEGNAQPGLFGLFSSFSVNQPQIFIDVDRTKAKAAGVPLDQIFDTLQTCLGSAYVNDFTRFERNWQVNVQADSKFRYRVGDIGKLQVRNDDGKMVPLDALLSVRFVSGPAIYTRYNMYPSADLSGSTMPGTSSGQAIERMALVARKTLYRPLDYEWTELSLQESLAAKDYWNKFVFPLGALLAFLVLAFFYESWSLPISIILIVPMCLSSAIAGVFVLNLLVGLNNNIFTQIGLVVLIGLAAKNAILIVEFAKEQKAKGLKAFDAALEASRLRLRPILMTSLAFILGVVPLIVSEGAGAEMRVSLGVAVFAGMLGVTLFGIFYTPVFYVTILGFVERAEMNKHELAQTAQPEAKPEMKLEDGAKTPGTQTAITQAKSDH